MNTPRIDFTAFAPMADAECHARIHAARAIGPGRQAASRPTAGSTVRSLGPTLSRRHWQPVIQHNRSVKN